MARNEQGAPRAPQIEFLLKMVERLDEIINSGDSLGRISDAKSNEALEIVELYDEQLLVGWRDAFDWVAVFLENRRDYHKKRNTKTKIEMQLMEDALQRAGVDTKKLAKEAERAADDSIS